MILQNDYLEIVYKLFWHNNKVSNKVMLKLITVNDEHKNV